MAIRLTSLFTLARLKPDCWSTWAILLGLRLLAWLPYPALFRLGGLFGRVLYHASPGRREIARVNLALCFPDLDESARERLLRDNFRSLGMAVCETAMAYFWSDQRLKPLARVEGLEHLQSALAKGRGALLLTCHFTHLEVSGHLLAIFQRISLMYREHKDPMMDEVIRRSRASRAHDTVERNDLRAMIRELKRGHAVWYAPDQNYGGTSQVAFVPFFGIPALTVTATSRLARMTGAAVVPFFPQRLNDAMGYRIRLLPAVGDFPGSDEVADTARVNDLIEAEIRRAPEQYLWVHRRFKTRPKGVPSPYPD